MSSPVRSALSRRLQAARARTDHLFALVTPEGLLQRPIAERHRLLFYVGHLEVFDWNLLSHLCSARPPQNPALEALFAFGIDPLGGDLPNDTRSDWPPLPEIFAWALRLRADVDADLSATPLSGWMSGGWAANLAIEHRLMHAETLAYLLNRLPPEFKRGPSVPRDI